MEKIKNELKSLLNKSYSPYSNFQVAAILETEYGKFSGVNVENFGIISICAERTAFLSAIANMDDTIKEKIDKLKKEDPKKAKKEFQKVFKRIYIMGKHQDKDTLEDIVPCGHCRQFMCEFVSKDFELFCFGENSIKKYNLEELFPRGFELEE